MRVIVFLIFCLGLNALAYAAKAPYEVKVIAPTSQAQSILEENLDLITQRSLEGLDQDQIEILVEETPEQAQKFLETLGYFDSKVSIEKDNNTYLVSVELGDPIRVQDVQVLVDGAFLQDDDLAERYRKMMEGWVLPINSVFTQDGWSTSKSAVLRSITAESYPLAKITESKAIIDPEAKSAALSVHMQSNQFIRFGDISVVGNERYPANVVTGMADFDKGTPYTLSKLLDYQNALEQDGHYSSAAVGPRFDLLSENDEYVPLTVQVVEVPRQKFDIGLKYDTAEGASANAGYTHYNVFKRGYTGSIAGKFGNYEQSFGLGLSLPRRSSGYLYSMSANFENSEVQKLRTKSGSAGIWQIRQKGNIDSRFGFEYLMEQSRVVDGGESLDFGSSHALMARFGWTQRKIDNQMHPRNGYLADLNLASTLGSFASSTTFIRANARAVYYYTPKNTKIGTFVAHAEMGHIAAKNKDKVPKTLLFRIGGAGTVRGYEYQGIGIDLPNDAVIGGTSMALASLEYQYPITDTVSLAVFHDEGGVGKDFKEFKFDRSNGFGVRWFSPVAPLSVDVAHASKDNKIRWHLSLGLVF
ncbi:autotransporter assembly complex protein TamA [Neisseria sp. Ec49-e6-T10]|uniref:autotransporter assembly complex protein TamA n=1 Tax=Neisseria sp. Ec49-e6-T10 TaxID=3140744 RepID=UPI003EBF49E7